MTKMKANLWQFLLPWQFSGTMWGASPDEAHLGLHWKPLDADIGRVPEPYCPGGCHGQRICCNTQKH